MRSNFAGDFNCRSGVEITEIAQNRFRASGCGVDAVYQCVNHGAYHAETLCSLEMTQDGDSEPSGDPPHAPRDSRPGEARVANTKGGDSAVRLDLKLDDATLLKLSASPAGKSKKVQLRLMVRGNLFSSAESNTDEEETTQCELGWLVNGQRMEGPSTKVSHEQNVVTYRASLPPLFVRELSVARKLSLRLCDRKWSLRPEQLAEVRHFFELYEEEQAWEGKPRKGGTDGLVAPDGGWPEWQSPDAKMPVAVSGNAFDSPSLFKQVKRSVYQVEALLSQGSSQGSAVAVTPSELLTNCHVVEQSRKIVVKREKKEWIAKLSRSDPGTDRCVLLVDEPILEPVAGVRTWDSLEVGEPLYALGSPGGLELSLSNGILSGRREEDGVQLVQTTAPISPGSSGGGLFDARGNLVGITTLVFVGRDHMNQALNFAIPAERFFVP